MSEYWKSLPRKFCEACKCWFADNRASIDFHEKGKRHQENVQKRLNLLIRKGQKEYEAQKKYETAMKKIEREAHKAFTKDVANNPALASQYADIKLQKKPAEEVEKLRPNSDCLSRVSKIRKKVNSEPVKNETRKCWFEAKSEDGGIYYWNSETGESQWEEPSEYVTLAAQESTKPKGNHDISSPVPSIASSRVLEFGPAPMSQPYGQWMPVVKIKEKTLDLQLPTFSEEPLAATIVLAPEETGKKFKQKVVGDLSDKYGDSSNEGFKRRKNIAACKRNIRRRDDD